MTDDQVIDIREYLAESPEVRSPGTFSVVGGGGERSRFAMPVWRTIYLVGGDWGGIVALPKDVENPTAKPVFALDLRLDPARTEIPTRSLNLLLGKSVPALATTMEGGFAISLGEDEEFRWFLQVLGGRPVEPEDRKDREALLFLAGECSGLLFFRKLATPLPSTSSAP
jgi:hypothetical protein